MGLNDKEIIVIFSNAGIPGPQGPPGTSGGEAVYASRLDTDHDPILYAGEAVPGSAEDESVWRIWRVDVSSGSTKLWANGASTFVNKWSEHLILTYS